jgi:hypothetical protein
MVDVSITAQKARAAKYQSTFRDGDAGVHLTRRSPVALTYKQTNMISVFVVNHLDDMRARRAFQDNVLARLSGAVSDSAVKAAICIAAKEIGFKTDELKRLGLVERDSSDKIPGGGEFKGRMDDDT